MIIAFILSVLISSLTGYYVLYALGLKIKSYLLQICLSIGVGLGVSSLIHFAIMFFTTDRLVIMMVEAGICVFLIGIVHYTKLLPANPIKSSTMPETPQIKRWQNILTFFLLIICIVVFGASIIIAMRNSHGNWDAWAIWNLRARYLFRSGLNWQSAYALQNSWSHPDYPLFLPLTVVRMWRYMGTELID
jgi:predicted membrane channel-forming protein YqfA (hemolysin III family)